MARATVLGNLLMRILQAGWMLPFYISSVGAADELAANPYRPSVGSPASLSAPVILKEKPALPTKLLAIFGRAACRYC